MRLVVNLNFAFARFTRIALSQDVFLPAPLEPLNPIRTVARDNFLKTVDGTQKVLVDWLSEVA